MNSNFQFLLDPLTGRATFKGKLPLEHVDGAISTGDIESLNNAIALINLRIEELEELVAQNVTNNFGQLEYVVVTGATQALTSRGGFISNNAGARVVMTLPVQAPVGSIIDVVGLGDGGWRIAQNAGQQIHFGNKVSTIGTGTMSSTHPKDNLRLVCVVADTMWVVLRAVGNPDIA